MKHSLFPLHLSSRGLQESPAKNIPATARSVNVQLSKGTFPCREELQRFQEALLLDQSGKSEDRSR